MAGGDLGTVVTETGIWSWFMHNDGHVTDFMSNLVVLGERRDQPGARPISEGVADNDLVQCNNPGLPSQPLFWDH